MSEDVDLICDNCGCEFPAHESMPDPETKHGDYCSECYFERLTEWDISRGITFLRKNLPSMEDFMYAYKKFAKGKSLDPQTLENNCHAAANTLVQLLRGNYDIKIQRGHWIGRDVRDGKNARTVQQHSWTKIKLPDNNVQFIVDPTQWVFTGEEPHLAVAEEDDRCYDFGGYGMKKALLGETPIPERTGKVLPTKFSKETKKWLSARADRDWSKWSIDEMIVIANMDPRSMCGHAKEIFDAIIKSGNKGFIPLEGLAIVTGEM